MVSGVEWGAHRVMVMEIANMVMFMVVCLHYGGHGSGTRHNSYDYGDHN